MAARGDFPFAQSSCQKLVLGRRCDGASALSGRPGSGGMAGAWAEKDLARPILLPRLGEPVGESGGPGAKTACVAFMSRGALGLLLAARGDFPFAQCSRQKLVLGRLSDGASAMSGRCGSGGMVGARFGPSVRWVLGDVRPRWLRGHGWSVGQEGLRAPNPASPPRRTRGEGISGTGDPQQISRAQGARSSPAPLCPLESGGPGAKTACVAFMSRGALGLLLAARGDFPFAQCCR